MEEDRVVEQMPEQATELMEVVLSVPVNTAMIRVVALTMGDSGEARELRGDFNLEQVLLSRRKYEQLVGMKENADEPREEGDPAGSSQEEKGEAEEGSGDNTAGEG